jgi:hypothetical protein
MPETSEQALTHARQLLGLPPSANGSAWRVRRLDVNEAYFLVHVGGRVACLDAASFALLTSATAAKAPVTVSPESARTIAGLGDAASTELVWKPSAATLSMFDPLWSVTLGGRVVFVDQRSKAWQTLPQKSPGGAG